MKNKFQIGDRVDYAGEPVTITKVIKERFQGYSYRLARYGFIVPEESLREIE